jgi:hypothetical protein
LPEEDVDEDELAESGEDTVLQSLSSSSSVEASAVCPLVALLEVLGASFVLALTLDLDLDLRLY